MDNLPKFYVCKAGAFYEGEIVAQYCWSGGDNYYYLCDVVIEKFIVHYDNNHNPGITFRYHEVGKKQLWSAGVDKFGIFFRKYRKTLAKKK